MPFFLYEVTAKHEEFNGSGIDELRDYSTTAVIYCYSCNECWYSRIVVFMDKTASIFTALELSET